MDRAALVWKVARGMALSMGWLLCARKAGVTAEVRVRCAGAASAWRMKVGRREAAMVEVWVVSGEVRLEGSSWWCWRLSSAPLSRPGGDRRKYEALGRPKFAPVIVSLRNSGYARLKRNTLRSPSRDLQQTSGVSEVSESDTPRDWPARQHPRGFKSKSLPADLENSTASYTTPIPRPIPPPLAHHGHGISQARDEP